jgi:membrane protease YdiL (CAAX protease family)
MAEKDNTSQESASPQVWKIIGMFALLFLAVEVVVLILGAGINALMNAIGAGENVRVFIGSTISRAGMIAASLLLTIPILTNVLKKPGNEILYPIKAGWGKDLLAGLGISAAAMSVVFLISLAFGWLKVEGAALSTQTWDACLRAVWLAFLVNATAAVGEEVLFRGFLLTGLRDAWDKSGALLISAIIFGGAHVLAAGAEETNWAQFIPMLALPGVMLGWAYLRTGNLWLATGLHFAWNLFQDDIFNLGGVSASDTLLGFQTSILGPKWFMGSSFGIEVGAAGIIALVIVVVGIWLYTKNKSLEKQHTHIT